MKSSDEVMKSSDEVMKSSGEVMKESEEMMKKEEMEFSQRGYREIGLLAIFVYGFYILFLIGDLYIYICDFISGLKLLK